MCSYTRRKSKLYDIFRNTFHMFKKKNTLFQSRPYPLDVSLYWIIIIKQLWVSPLLDYFPLSCTAFIQFVLMRYSSSDHRVSGRFLLRKAGSRGIRSIIFLGSPVPFKTWYFYDGIPNSTSMLGTLTLRYKPNIILYMFLCATLILFTGFFVTVNVSDP